MSQHSKKPLTANQGLLKKVELDTTQRTAQLLEQVGPRIRAQEETEAQQAHARDFDTQMINFDRRWAEKKRAQEEEQTAIDAQRRIVPDAQAIDAWWALGPRVNGRREYALQVTIRCPHCRKKHHHGFGPGTVIPHCGGPMADTAPHVYRIIGTDQVRIPERPTAPRKPAREAGTP